MYVYHVSLKLNEIDVRRFNVERDLVISFRDSLAFFSIRIQVWLSVGSVSRRGAARVLYPSPLTLFPFILFRPSNCIFQPSLSSQDSCLHTRVSRHNSLAGCLPRAV